MTPRSRWERGAIRHALAALFVLVAGVSCVAAVSDDRRGGGASRDDYGCDVPPGHLPPPGECRIWYRDRPPGHQPPPGDCHELRRRVPRNACLVTGE